MKNSVDSYGTFYNSNKINNKNFIVFIHGVGLTSAMWKPQINFFKEYNTLTYDLLGHGKTPLKRGKLGIDDFSEQLFKLINELNLNKIHLVGFSLGALIARDFASKYSNKLNSLIILGSIYKRSEDQKRVVINRFNLAKKDSPASKVASLRRWFTENFISNNPKVYEEVYSILENNNRKDFLKSYEIFVYYNDNDEIIKKIDVKTLVTTGQNDVGSTPEMSKNLSKIIKDSEFIEIKKGKHLCSIECADDVNIIFKKFIDENDE